MSRYPQPRPVGRQSTGPSGPAALRVRIRLPLVGIFVCIIALFALAVLIGPLGAAAGPPSPATVPGAAALPGDWPMYGHDVSRTNLNADETAINAGNVGQLVARWQINLGSNGGPSSSTPSVANGRVFVGSSAPSGDNFFAFDTLTGRRAWGANLHYVNMGCFDVGIGSSAAISGTLLVVGGGDDAYYGLDTQTGAILWRDPLEAGTSAYPWTSPALANGRAYVGVASRCDNPSVRGEVRAIDVATGQRLASQYFVPAGQAGAGVWNSLALTADGNTLVAATGEDYNGYNGPYNRALVTLDPRTLAIRQANQQGSQDQDLDYGTTPVVFHDSLGRLLVGANHKDGTFYAFEVSNLVAGPVWQRPEGTAVGMMPAYDPGLGNGGTLFFAGVGGQLYAIDPATGFDRWPTVHVGAMHGNMAIANGLIYINAGYDGVKVFREADGALLTTLLPQHVGNAYSGIAVAHGIVYWLSGSYLNAWSLPGTAPSPTPCPVTFSDVQPTDYFYGPVQDLSCRGVISGYADNTFRPYANTTRGQLVKIVVTAFNIPPHSPAQPTFSDVPRGQPFYSYIEAAVHAGVIGGYADGTFHPDSPVTRGQLTKIVSAAAGWGLITPGTASFTDVPAASPFAPFVETAVCHGIISGYTCGGPGEPCDAQRRRYFRSAAFATRGQIAKIVHSGVLSAPACVP